MYVTLKVVRNWKMYVRAFFEIGNWIVFNQQPLNRTTVTTDKLKVKKKTFIYTLGSENSRDK